MGDFRCKLDRLELVITFRGAIALSKTTLCILTLGTTILRIMTFGMIALGTMKISIVVLCRLVKYAVLSVAF